MKFNIVVDVPDGEVLRLLGNGKPDEPDVPVHEQTPAAETPSTKKKTEKRKGRPPSLTSMKKKAQQLIDAGALDKLKDILDEFQIKVVPDLEKERYYEFDGALDEAVGELETA